MLIYNKYGWYLFGDKRLQITLARQMACSAKTIDKSKKNEMWVWVFVVPASLYINRSYMDAIYSYNFFWWEEYYDRYKYK